MPFFNIDIEKEADASRMMPEEEPLLLGTDSSFMPYYCQACQQIPTDNFVSRCGHLFCCECYSRLSYCTACFKEGYWFKELKPVKALLEQIVNPNNSVYNAKCPICKGELTNARIGECGHAYCEPCIANSMSKDPNSYKCPICKHKFGSFPTVFNVGRIVENVPDLDFNEENLVPKIGSCEYRIQSCFIHVATLFLIALVFYYILIGFSKLISH